MDKKVEEYVQSYLDSLPANASKTEHKKTAKIVRERYSATEEFHVEQLDALVQIINEEIDSNYVLGVITNSRQQGSPITLTVYGTIGSPNHEAPVVWIHNDNNGDEINGISAHWETISDPPNKRKLKDVVRQVSATKGWISLSNIKRATKDGLYRVVHDVDTNSKIIHLRRGQFVTRIDASAGIDTPTNHTYVRTTGCNRGFVNLEDLDQIKLNDALYGDKRPIEDKPVSTDNTISKAAIPNFMAPMKPLSMYRIMEDASYSDLQSKSKRPKMITFGEYDLVLELAPKNQTDEFLVRTVDRSIALLPATNLERVKTPWGIESILDDKKIDYAKLSVVDLQRLAISRLLPTNVSNEQFIKMLHDWDLANGPSEDLRICIFEDSKGRSDYVLKLHGVSESGNSTVITYME